MMSCHHASILDCESKMLNWDQIEAIAERIGVPYNNYKKWRHRDSVPHKWRYPLILASGGTMSIKDFIDHDQKKGKAA